MDALSILGVSAAFFSIIFGQFLEGGDISSLLNGPAVLIVCGGTIGAVMLETPWMTFKRALCIMRWVIVPPKVDLKKQIRKIVQWSHVARKQGILGLESVIDNESDLFSKKALSLLVDGGEPGNIRMMMNLELENFLDHELHAARVFESMGGYSPTIGIIGAVLGLIKVMNNLTDPSKLGVGIAIAFVATIYGVGLANLVFLPISKKLRTIIMDNSRKKEMMIEGIVSISEGENPRIIELKLQGFLE